MVPKKYADLFDRVYHTPGKTLEDVLTELKSNGATQAITAFLLASRLKMSIPEADRTILNSAAWKDTKETIHKLRNEFGDFLEKENQND